MLNDLYIFVVHLSNIQSHCNVMAGYRRKYSGFNKDILSIVIRCIYTSMSPYNDQLQRYKVWLNFLLAIYMCIILRFFVIVCIRSVAVLQNIEKFWCHHSANLIQYMLCSNIFPFLALQPCPTESVGGGAVFGLGSQKQKKTDKIWAMRPKHFHLE